MKQPYYKEHHRTPQNKEPTPSSNPVTRSSSILDPFRTSLHLGVALALLLVTSGALALTEDYALDIRGAVFYTFALTAIAVSTAIIVAYKEFRWLAYVALSLLMLCTVASMDGTLAYLLGGSDYVLWVVPYLFLSTSAAFGFYVISMRLEEPHRLCRLRPLFVGLAGLSLLFPLSSPLWLERISLVLMWIPVTTLFFTMVVCQILPPMTWNIQDPQQRLLTRALPIMMAVFSIAVHVVHYSGGGFSQAQLNDFNRITALLFTIFSLMIVVWQVVANTREKLRTERKALEAERNEAQMQLELLRAEADYQDALSAASMHRSRLATVSHDLKQPVASLRHAVDQMQRAGRNEDADKLSRAVDYVASLSRAYVVSDGDGVDDPADMAKASSYADDEEPRSAEGQAEVVESSVFARMLDQMFQAQAAEQGVRLRVFCGDSSLRVEPLSSMRIMTNLVSNALAHAQAARMLVALRPRGDRVEFMVLDNGVGMDEQTLGDVSQAGIKGEHSDGQGLGLSIVRELCDGAGMTFNLCSVPGSGTSAVVSMPRHAPAAAG